LGDIYAPGGPQAFEEMMAGFFEWVGDPVEVNVVSPFLVLPDSVPESEK
jgi:hypothetical protein